MQSHLWCNVVRCSAAHEGLHPRTCAYGAVYIYICLCACVCMCVLTQGWGEFELSTKERRPTRRNITGVVWNDEWHAIKMMLATRGEQKKVQCCCLYKCLVAVGLLDMARCVFVCVSVWVYVCVRVCVALRMQSIAGAWLCT